MARVLAAGGFPEYGDVARIAEYRASAERARAKLHAAMHPADGFPGGQGVGGRVQQAVLLHDVKDGAAAAQPVFNFVL